MRHKHAYLIIAHNQFEVLQYLLKSLDSIHNDIYLHIDKKVKKIDTKTLKSCVKYSSLHILKNRIDVQWGTYSLVQCELNLLESALKYDRYSYFHLMSGVDMPLKPADEIYDYFEERYGTEFVHFDSDNFGGYKERVSKYWLFPMHNNNPVRKVLSHVSMLLQIFVDRTKRTELEFRKGSNWFHITDRLGRYVIENKKLIEKMFKYTFCCDEIFLQTLVWNSSFVKMLVQDNFQNNYKNIMYLIDWKRGNPYEFLSQDFKELITSGMLFARKFNGNKDIEIVKEIWLLTRRESGEDRNRYIP